MENKILSVKNLSCKYSNGRTVLKVEDFTLHRGEVVFLLGPSGIGKSTFIEAIGLINNTSHVDADTTVSYYLNSNEEVNIAELWNGKNEKLEAFRRDHFSFIFQNNYLMPNLTAGENMMLTLLMKGETEVSAKEKILDLLKVVHLHPDVMDKNVFNVSGGQKQRLAFVRAIASPFEILIGDEPTGNLDSVTAHALMDFTRNQIIADNKSGIFVSHDVNLALTYADRIYLFMSENKDDGILGRLNSKHLLTRSNDVWKMRNEVINQPEEYVRRAFVEII